MSTTADEPTRAPSTEGARVVLDGAGLDVGGVVRLADNDAVPEVTGEALARVRHAWETAERLAARGRLYGRGTGVGAHRQVAVEEDELAGHGLRLLRSHAGGAGAVLPARQARAMLAVRTNQLLAGGSGIHPDFVEALAEALRLGVHPALTEYGSVGTGDLTALAQTGLTLLGEQPWLGGTREAPGPEAGLPRPAAPAREPGRPAPDRAAREPRPRERHGASGLPSETPRPPRGTDVPALPGGTGTRVAAPCTDGSPIPVPRRPRSGTGVPRPSAAPAGLPAPVALRPGDALALLSSNALALGQAALACHDLTLLLRAAHAVAALSLLAVSGATEAYAAPVHAVRPYPGPARAAAEVRRLLALPDRPPPGGGRRIQDPYGFRAFPQVHGAALDAAERLRHVVETEINCPTENPLIAPDGTAYHHGGFYAAPLGLALDGADLALLGTAQLSAARLSALGRADLTGLPAFLAEGPAGSSGTMILEYTAHSALAELRASAAPASAGHAVLSHGLEEAAGFASQAARQALRAVEAYRTVLACELVVAVRALRLSPAPPDLPAFALASAALPGGTEDRPLTADVAAAADLLPRLARL
ncbi:aromatic amino acid lyase [Streptomyces jietaisiensis]|uniref:Aromatic amino acid lyase n=1 Tax=Streptomyces griseoaurantiacus TaxID=68213 RepID=A0ABZ1V0I1_9ACTN|nr:aromatic amino acid lyase [Streptomyces jietaisiensis]